MKMWQDLDAGVAQVQRNFASIMPKPAPFIPVRKRLQTIADESTRLDTVPAAFALGGLACAEAGQLKGLLPVSRHLAHPHVFVLEPFRVSMRCSVDGLRSLHVAAAVKPEAKGVSYDQ